MPRRARPRKPSSGKSEAVQLELEFNPSSPAPFIWFPDQHRRQAAKLRATKHVELAACHDALAYMIEQRLGMSAVSPPIAPQ